MTLAVTQRFDQLVLQMEDPDNAGTFLNICGLIDVSIERSAQTDTAEVPHCDDESLPLSVERSVRTIEVRVTGTGVWAQSSHGLLMDWFYSSASRNIRIRNENAAVGDTEYEAGKGLLTQLSHQRTKGQKVQASITIEFDGTPTRTAKPTP